MQPTQSHSELGALLLVFYECLTDPDHLDTLMEMLTAWLDSEDGEILSPKLEDHAEKAWRLLGEISEADYEPSIGQEAHASEQFASEQDTKSALWTHLDADDQKRLKEWLAAKHSAKALLLKVHEENSTELIVVAREFERDGFLVKRTGAEFHGIISKFVADSFELTHAELALVQELLLGGTLREIAERLGKSWETTRSQVKSLTNKLGVSSQADILRLVNQAASLMPAQRSNVAADQNAQIRKLTRPDGRTIVYEIDGSSSSRTLVFLHGMTQGRHWPEKARQMALSRGWRVVRISRAGRGASTLNPKEGEPLLKDHTDDVIAIMNQEGIDTFSIFGAADGFAVGYCLALQYPERVEMIVGLEVVPPIVSRKVVSGFSGKMKTFGLACLYAPKTIKFMFGLAMRNLERMEDRYNVVHPLIGVELAKYEDADGIQADDRNFKDLMEHNAEGMWRDASFSCVDWAFAPANSNVRPRVALIHSGNSMVKSPGYLDEFAVGIGAPIYRIDCYLPYISAALPSVLNALEPV